jgi:DNA-binding MarR family transcriptional regulator
MGGVNVTEDELLILKEANRRYPVTVEELRGSLRMRPAAFDLALRSLVRKGLVELEPLEGSTFVRPRARTTAARPPPPPDERDYSYL